MNEVDDISLGRVGVAPLQLKDLFYTIVLKGSTADEQLKLSGQVFAQYKILLASDLKTVSRLLGLKMAAALLTPSRRLSRSFLALSRR